MAIQLITIVIYRKLIAFILIDKIDYSKLSTRDLVSPDVMDIYILAVTNPEYFSCSKYTVDIVGRSYSIWTANSIESRRFYMPCFNNEKLSTQIDGMNEKLTIYDKHLLDNLCAKVKEGQLESLKLFF